MKAAIVTIGSELASGRVTDTNRDWLAQRLIGLGLMTDATFTAPDSASAIGHVLGCALASGPELIVISGGLGPTHDDITAAAVSRRLGLALVSDNRAAEMVAAAVGGSADALPPHQAKQAMLPEGSTALMPAGTAPGFLLRAGGTLLVALPGVPGEMKQMWMEAQEEGPLRDLVSQAPEFGRRSLFLYGTGEPQADAVIRQFLERAPGGEIKVTICSHYGEVLIDIDYRREHEAAAGELEASLVEAFADTIFSYGDRIEMVTGRELAGRDLTVATAESCTAGMLGETITNLSGSSEYYLGGIISYHNDVKRKFAGVSGDTLEKEGAVSETVARQMASGVREAIGADYGVGITGIAGPGGGTPEKPVGLVYISVSSDSGTVVHRFDFPGPRQDVRRAAVISSLHMLRKKVLADSSDR